MADTVTEPTSSAGWHRETLVVIGVMLLIGPLITGILAAIHPLVPWAVAIALVVTGITGGSASHTDTDHTERTTCGECGARVPADEPACDYCGEPFGDATPG